MVLEKTPLDKKETRPVNRKRNQPWILIGRNSAEAEAPILWPPDAKSPLVLCVRACSVASAVSDSAKPWTETCQAPLSMGILQARIPKWVAYPFSRGSSQLRNQTGVSCIAGRFFYQLSYQGSLGKLLVGCCFPGDLPDPGIKPTSLASLFIGRWVVYH